MGILTGVEVANTMNLLLGEGFLASYTTFSTFMYEEVRLVQGNKKRNALIYITGTLFISLIGYISGYTFGKVI